MFILFAVVGEDREERMSPRTARAVIAALVVVIAASFAWVALRPAVARTVDRRVVVGDGQRVQAPELVAPAGFLNSEPVTLASLRGKVVLIDFWTYSCINCQRTFPYIRQWWDTYRDNGLVVLGVHTPEFDFEAIEANVAAVLPRYGVTWPVVLDPQRRTWNAWSNRYWPAKYLVDRNGRVAYAHFGEGQYLATEQAIRALLSEGGADPGPPALTGAEPPGSSRRDQTPELYAGYQRGGLANQGGYRRDVLANYTLPVQPPSEGFAVGGSWTARLESLETSATGASVIVPFQAGLVHMVASGSTNVVVTLDDLPVPPDRRPTGMTVRPDGSTALHIDRADLYTLIDGPTFGRGVLRLRVDGDRFSLYSFTFGA